MSAEDLRGMISSRADEISLRLGSAAYQPASSSAA